MSLIDIIQPISIKKGDITITPKGELTHFEVSGLSSLVSVKLPTENVGEVGEMEVSSILLDIIKEERGEITLKDDGNKLKIETVTGEYSLFKRETTLQKIKFEGGSYSVAINRENLIGMLKGCVPILAKDYGYRSVVRIEIGERSVRGVATDGYCLVHYKGNNDEETGVSSTQEIHLSLEDSLRLLKILEKRDEEFVLLSWNESKTCFEVGEITAVFLKQSVKYPDYEKILRIFPEDYKELNIPDLKGALKRASKVGNVVKVNVQQYRTELTVEQKDGSFSETIDTENELEIVFGISAEQMIKLWEIGDRLWVKDPKSAIFVTNSMWTKVIMPHAVAL